MAVSGLPVEEQNTAQCGRQKVREPSVTPPEVALKCVNVV